MGLFWKNGSLQGRLCLLHIFHSSTILHQPCGGLEILSRCCHLCRHLAAVAEASSLVLSLLLFHHCCPLKSREKGFLSPFCSWPAPTLPLTFYHSTCSVKTRQTWGFSELNHLLCTSLFPFCCDKGAENPIQEEAVPRQAQLLS